MVRLLQYIKSRYVDRRYVFKDRLYFLFGSAGAISAGAAFAAAIGSNLPWVAVVASMFSFIFMLLLMTVSFFMESISINRVVCAAFLNFFMFPALFWVTGGVNCGMVFYFMLGLSVAALILDGRVRLLILAGTLLLDSLCLYWGFEHPELSYQLSYAERQADTVSSFVIVAVFIIAVIVIMTHEYEREHGIVEANAEHLREQAVTDSLTTLYNQRYLMDALNRLIAQKAAGTHGEEMSVAMFDIDDFKRINDQYGHLRGNLVLCQFASILKKEAGEHNIPIRYGGEEFLVLLPESGLARAAGFAESVRVAVLGNEAIQALCENRFSVSCGVAQYRAGMSADEWIGAADAKLYEAKHNGKNQVMK